MGLLVGRGVRKLMAGMSRQRRSSLSEENSDRASRDKCKSGVANTFTAAFSNRSIAVCKKVTDISEVATAFKNSPNYEAKMDDTLQYVSKYKPTIELGTLIYRRS